MLNKYSWRILLSVANSLPLSVSLSLTHTHGSVPLNSLLDGHVDVTIKSIPDIVAP